jgi:phosphatidylethanolamine-binding protein (PEBP) family uncharacterized protein/uncharacterized membrane protein YgcG
MRARVGLPLLSLALASLLAGCGGSSSTSTSTTVPVSPATAPTKGSVARVDAVAYVAGTPIPKASYTHWLSVERALGATSSPSHAALGFLITSEWMLGEAAARGITVSEAEVKQRLAELERKSFPKAGSLQKFLSKSGETEADLLARIKVELLASRIAAKIAAGKSSAQRTTLLAGFQKNFQTHWRGLTSCNPGYVMEDCKQYKGAPEAGVSSGSTPSTSTHASGGSSSSGGPSSSGSGSSKSGSSSSSGASSSGEIPPPPAGAMALTSPAFELNGAIPAKYTCTGAGISPPLEWKNIPSKAAELVLFVIDDSADGSSGGIRWIVGGIDPSSTGVAEGKLPPGGIVGTNDAGKAGYSPICPAHGKSDTVELVLYALSKTIPLSTGFQPDVAESEYGSGKLLLGQAAVTYAVASRP